MSARPSRPSTAGPDNGPEPPFPLRLDGKVIKGFGRGSKELGIPTANIPIEGLSVGGHDEVESGVYYGWAGLSPSAATGHHASSESKAHGVLKKAAEGVSSVVPGGSTEESEAKQTLASDKGAVYPMVMSIGWNPFYKNTVRSVEVHIMHHFTADFYDSHMNLMILGFIRPELDYTTKEALIDDIKTDIKVAENSLARKPYAKLKDESYLLDFEGKSDVAK